MIEKKVTENKTATRNFHLQLKQYKAFDRCINSMNSLFLSTINEECLIKLIQQPSKTIKYAFVQIGGKLDELPNQRRDTVSREMIQITK